MEKSNISPRVTNPLTRLIDEYKALDRRGKLTWWGNLFVRNAIYIIIVILVIYVQAYSIRMGFSNRFLSFDSIIDIVKRAGAGMFLALGVGGIIVLTGTDLSAGRIMGFTACVCASLLQREDFAVKMFPNLATPPIILVLLLVMIIGAAIGVVNGFFVAKFSLHPFIVTLATSIVLNGIVLWYVQLGRNGGGPIAGLTAEYSAVVKDNIMIGGTAIPYYVFYAIIATAVMWFIWNKTTLGKNMYAVGANPEAANVSGVSIMATTISIFTIAGVLYGFSGFVEAARIGSNGPTTGVMAELDAIAACVIGGVSFTGGTGKISGIVTGVILLNIIAVALQWLGVSSDIRLVITGAMILTAVTIDMRKYHTKK